MPLDVLRKVLPQVLRQREHTSATKTPGSRRATAPMAAPGIGFAAQSLDPWSCSTAGRLAVFDPWRGGRQRVRRLEPDPARRHRADRGAERRLSLGALRLRCDRRGRQSHPQIPLPWLGAWLALRLQRPRRPLSSERSGLPGSPAAPAPIPTSVTGRLRTRPGPIRCTCPPARSPIPSTAPPITPASSMSSASPIIATSGTS